MSGFALLLQLRARVCLFVCVRVLSSPSALNVLQNVVIGWWRAHSVLARVFWNRARVGAANLARAYASIHSLALDVRVRAHYTHFSCASSRRPLHPNHRVVRCPNSAVATSRLSLSMFAISRRSACAFFCIIVVFVAVVPLRAPVSVAHAVCIVSPCCSSMSQGRCDASSSALTNRVLTPLALTHTRVHALTHTHDAHVAKPIPELASRVQQHSVVLLCVATNDHLEYLRELGHALACEQKKKQNEARCSCPEPRAGRRRRFLRP